MKETQTEKFALIDESTLLVGVDVAKNRHAARCFNFRGQALCKAFQFENNKNGFCRLLRELKEQIAARGLTKVVVGMEPTGSYWFALYYWLRNQGIMVVVVNPMHVNRSKELDDNSPTKTDTKDTSVIARLVRDARFSEGNLPTGVYAELRNLVTAREQVRDTHTQALCRLRTWLNRFFPEFETVFDDVLCISAVTALRKFPLPADIMAHSVVQIGAAFRTATKGRVWMKHAHLLRQVAQDSIGVTEGLTAARIQLGQLLDQLELYAKQLSQIEAELVAVFLTVPVARYLVTIPGLSPLQAAIIVAELGDLAHYQHPKQLQKMAGLGLQECSSGEHKGRRKISKRGRRRLRATLYLAVLGMVTHNPEFRQLHQRLKQRSTRPLTGKQSLIALCVKLLSVIFALAKHQQPYDPARLAPSAIAA